MRYWCVLAAMITLTSVSAPAVGQTGHCGVTLVVSPAPTIARWASSKKILIGEDFREQIVTQFCAAAGEILGSPASANQLRPTAPQINAVADATISEYLDTYSDTSRQVRTLNAALRSHLGVQGFSRPVARSYGIVRFTYRTAVDRVRLRGKNFEPWPAFFVLRGPADYIGYSGARQICHGQIAVGPAAPTLVTCG